MLAWCPSTEEQGFAGSEAPRPTGRNPILLQRRGARRRKNKALRGAKHHAQPAEIRFCSKGVVPDDERTRHCGERSTTPTGRIRFCSEDVVPVDGRTRCCGERSTTTSPPKPHFVPKAWCPSTEEQGVAGSEAPRPTGRNPILLQRRGARRRKNKVLRGAKHHVQPAETPFCPKDVVLVDGRTRFCRQHHPDIKGGNYDF